MIQRQTVRDHLVDYLNHKTNLAQLVDWAEKGNERRDSRS